MDNESKAKLYDRFMSEYHSLENEISLIKMNKIDLNESDTKSVSLLERKKVYIMGEIERLSAGLN